MRKEELIAKTRDELRVLAKEHQIVGRSKMNKDQLAEALLQVCMDPSPEAGVEVVDSPADAKYGYIKTAEKGTIMAFKLPDGKVKSAKMVERSLKREKLKLETAYGRQFVVSFSDVIWVKTGERWPKGVFNLLKGLKGNENHDKEAQAQ